MGKERIFESLNDLNKYIHDSFDTFVLDAVNEFFVEKLIHYAREEVYDVYKPTMYEREFTMLIRDMYSYKSNKAQVSASSYERQIYTYSTSPHAQIVVDGEPYDYDFLFNGVPRPFAQEAVNYLETPVGNKELEVVVRRALARSGIQTH